MTNSGSKHMVAFPDSKQKGKAYCFRHAAICVPHLSIIFSVVLVECLDFCSVMFKDPVKRLISYTYVTLPPLNGSGKSFEYLDGECFYKIQK